jgi:hypothetical protein
VNGVKCELNKQVVMINKITPLSISQRKPEEPMEDLITSALKNTSHELL